MPLQGLQILLTQQDFWKPNQISRPGVITVNFLVQWTLAHTWSTVHYINLSVTKCELLLPKRHGIWWTQKDGWQMMNYERAENRIHKEWPTGHYQTSRARVGWVPSQILQLPPKYKNTNMGASNTVLYNTWYVACFGVWLTVFNRNIDTCSLPIRFSSGTSIVNVVTPE